MQSDFGGHERSRTKTHKMTVYLSTIRQLPATEFVTRSPFALRFLGEQIRLRDHFSPSLFLGDAVERVRRRRRGCPRR
jgi:hypothetical protein